MKKSFSKMTAFLLAMVMLVTTASGCGKSDQAKKTVFKVGKEAVTLSEVWFYCKTVQEYYEQYYSAMFSDPKAWTSAYPVEKEDGSTEQSTLENVAKRSAIKQIREVKIAAKKADEKGIKLSSSEKKNIKEQADSFIKNVTKEERKKMGVTQELAEDVFTQSMKVQKLKEKLAKEKGLEISDEEAQTSKIYYIDFPIQSASSTTQSAEATTEAAGEEQKKLKKNAQDALAQVKNGSDMASVASSFGVSDSSGEINVNSDTNLPEKISKAISGLKDGEIYDKVIETEDGYYIIKMVSVVDEQATADKKENLLAKKEEELLTKQFKKWTKNDKFDYDKDVNWDYMKEIDFVKESSITTQASTTAAEDATTESTDAATTQEDTTQEK